MSQRYPAGFVAHGSPTLATDPERGAPLGQWAGSLPRPSAFLVISAHYEDSPLMLGTTATQELLYDFYGFPPELYEFRYPAPGAPELASEVSKLLAETPPQESRRPLDHGAWVPLVFMAPKADLPVLELSMPRDMTANELFELGRKLAPLRDEGVWLLGSGNVVHNLRQLDWTERSAPPSWAAEFDAWVADVVSRHDWDALLDYENRAPSPRLSHPTDEHLRPLFVVAGAAESDAPSFPFVGWEYGSLSRRCVQLG